MTRSPNAPAFLSPVRPTPDQQTLDRVRLLSPPAADAPPVEKLQHAAALLGLLSHRVLVLGERAADTTLAADCAEVRAQYPLLKEVRATIEQALREIERPDLTMRDALLEHLAALRQRYGERLFVSKQGLQEALNKDQRTMVRSSGGVVHLGHTQEFETTLLRLVGEGLIESTVAHAAMHYRITRKGEAGR